MTVDARVLRPAPEADRVRPTRVAVAAVLGLCCGLGGVWLVGRSHAPSERADVAMTRQGEREPEAAAAQIETEAGSGVVAESEAAAVAVADAGGAAEPTADAATESETLAESESEPAADTDTDTDTEPAAESEAAAESERETETEPETAAVAVTGTTSASAREVVLGTVAYLRCDGLELGTGRFPCPRDRALEAAGWEALEALAACDGDPGRGTLEIRVELTGHDVTDLRYRGIDDARIDAAVADDCLGTRLRALHTELVPKRMIVAFRVDLR